MTPLPTPSPQVLTRSVRYPATPGTLLTHLAHLRLIPTLTTPEGTDRATDTILLETADIATKASRTTIAVLDASTRLTCHGSTVTVEALPLTGSTSATDDADAPSLDAQAAFQQLTQALPKHVHTSTPLSLTLDIPAATESTHPEERDRLTALSTVEPLRQLAARTIDHPHLPLIAGVTAFDYLASFEQLPSVAPGPNTCPDYLMWDARIILVIDHPTASATLVGASLDSQWLSERMDALAQAIDSYSPHTPQGSTTPSAQTPTRGAHASPAAMQEPAGTQGEDQSASPTVHARPTCSDAAFEDMVLALKESIAAGDIYQVVPSRGFTMDCPDALAAYHVLRESNPSPYMFYVAAQDFELIGASPESSLLYSAATNTVAIRPIAGTKPRGLNPDGSVNHERDTRLELELRTDAKEIAEHVMLVDLARNDVARVSAPGTRRVDDLMRVDRYSRVMHLVSEVSGQLAPDLDALDAFRASMTMGTLTGAPKLRAAELIREHEGVRRGSYGGTVGYLRGDGEFDTCIVIRSAFVRGGKALVQAGAGVVGDSIPAMEAAETVHKARAVLDAVARAQGAQLVIEEGE